MIGGPHLVRFPYFFFRNQTKNGPNFHHPSIFLSKRAPSIYLPPPKWQFFKCTPPPPVYTGFHPVWYDMSQNWILLLRRFHLIPLYKIRPAGTNFRIRLFILSVSVIVLQEHDQLSLFLRMRAQIIHRTTKSSPKSYFNCYLKS
jgi:hypothetical protein